MDMVKGSLNLVKDIMIFLPFGLTVVEGIELSYRKAIKQL